MKFFPVLHDVRLAESELIGRRRVGRRREIQLDGGLNEVAPPAANEPAAPGRETGVFPPDVVERRPPAESQSAAEAHDVVVGAHLEEAGRHEILDCRADQPGAFLPHVLLESVESSQNRFVIRVLRRHLAHDVQQALLFAVTLQIIELSESDF